MRVHGHHRPRTAHNEPASDDRTMVEAEGPDFATARDALRAQIPDGHQLLHIITDR